jgi:hypothetical protein
MIIRQTLVPAHGVASGQLKFEPAKRRKSSVNDFRQVSLDG